MKQTHEMLRKWGAALDSEIPKGTGATLIRYANDWKDEIEALRKDAARYRYLRANGEPYPQLNYLPDWTPEMYDAAIDEAMKAKT